MRPCFQGVTSREVSKSRKAVKLACFPIFFHPRLLIGSRKTHGTLHPISTNVLRFGRRNFSHVFSSTDEMLLLTGKKSVNCLIWTTLISSFVNFVKWPCRLSIVIYTDRELTKNKFLFQKLLFVSLGRLGFKTDLHNLHNLTVNLSGLFFFLHIYKFVISSVYSLKTALKY